MSTLFTKIINREIPAAIVYEDDSYIAFMDAFPQMEGHMLVCPKEEIAHIFDLSDETYAGLFRIVKKLAPALEEATGALRIGLEVEGFAVPHVHVHMLPLHEPLGIIGKQANIDDLQNIAKKIKYYIDL